MDKMTSACFHDHVSTRLSRRIEEPLQEQVDDKPTQKETKLANPEDERRSQHKSTRTTTNPILYSSSFNVPVTSWIRKEEYRKSVDPKKTVKVSKKKSGYSDEDDKLTSPSTISFVIMSFPYLLTQTDEIFYLEIQSIFWTILTT